MHLKGLSITAVRQTLWPIVINIICFSSQWTWRHLNWVFSSLFREFEFRIYFRICFAKFLRIRKYRINSGLYSNMEKNLFRLSQNTKIRKKSLSHCLNFNMKHAQALTCYCHLKQHKITQPFKRDDSLRKLFILFPPIHIPLTSLAFLTPGVNYAKVAGQHQKMFIK